MKERPIIFSGPMVREILAGRKTQTRRIVKNDPPFYRTCPYGIAGERLWIRECWAHAWDSTNAQPKIAYAADLSSGRELKWRPSIHMPRWASRITLEITGIRVERLQDISYNDVIAEGFHEWLTDEQQTDSAHMAQAKYSFGVAWDHLNRKRASWGSNPWVWVIEFTSVMGS